ASDTPENLQRLTSGNGQIVAEIAAPVMSLRQCFSQMEELAHFEIADGDKEFHRCTLTPRNEMDLRPAVFALARDRGWTVRELTRNRHSLEDIYVQITQPHEEESE
ncbi:MAG TPA: hypothetical protein VN516_03485, partial [Candidatus Baltobacteraceae bacterium]|nr:hypothetical protein [Candidatus Baltobacteraceae bacterium]